MEYVFFKCLFVGIQCTLEDVINKWKKLKQQYKTYLDKTRRSGTEKRKKWKFYDEMDQVCGNRATSTPVCLIDSSMTNDSSGKNYSNFNNLCCQTHTILVQTL